MQCKGLLAPFDFYKIPSVAVVQVSRRNWRDRLKVNFVTVRSNIRVQ